MSYKFLTILLLAFVLACTSVFAQKAEPPQKDDKKEDTKKEKTLTPPTNMPQAKEIFLKACTLEKEQKLEDALAHYNVVVSFFQKLPEVEGQRYTMIVLNNMGVILFNQGKYHESLPLFKGALELAVKLDDYSNVAEFYHKLGILYSQLQSLELQKGKMKNVIGVSKVEAPQKTQMGDGTYTQISKTGDEFSASRIKITGNKNPFERNNDLYSKLVNVKIRDDFNPDALLVPDAITFLVQIEKAGYFKVSKIANMLPEMEYTEINETMQSMPRSVEALLTEDFYRQGSISADELTLSPMLKTGAIGTPIQITDKEKFKPGSYRLTIKKRGYDANIEPITIYPGEGSFSFARELKSSLRAVLYRVQGDFTALGGGQIQPDEISLNGQLVKENSQVKPGEYKLLIKKEGYEPVVRTLIIEPDERPFYITEYMKALPREIIFEITGDYLKDEPLTPDEVTLNGRPIKFGESIRPDAYRIMTRKKGYDPDADRITVEPKNGPFVFKKRLSSTPRRIQLNITSEFPPNLRIFPDTCTFNNRPIRGDESFKPGEYTLNIARTGYEPVTKQVKMPPDEVPYEIVEVLKAKPVLVNLEITQDVPHDNPAIKPQVTLLNEKTKETIPLKDGDKIAPESYLLKIEMDGYEPLVSKELIMPSELPYKMSKKLISSLRNVIAKVIAEYPPEENIIPDEITLDNKGISKDFKVKPGPHDLVILKEGYMPIRKSIKVGANSLDYLLTERLDTRTRLVNFKFRDSLERDRDLTPEEVILNQQKLANASETINLKPGEYSLKANLKGYSSVDDNILITVGVGPITIEKFMTAIKRDVVRDITGDFNPGKKLDPDVITLSNIPVGEGKTSIKPGPYNLIIQKDGYFPVLENIMIRPDPKEYLLKYTLVSKPRQVQATIKSSFNDTKIDPDNIVLGSQSIKSGQDVKPNSYALMIAKKGYKTISDNITVEPSSKAYLLERTLEALPVLVKYEIINDFDEKPAIPDVITLGDKMIDQKTAFVPGKYSLKIEKLGFNPIAKEVLIEPNDQAFVIKETLVSIPREIDHFITGDYPAGERIEVEVFALNGKDVRENTFKPNNNYQLDIQQAGYTSLKETLSIPPGEGPFRIERILITKHRLVKEKITYDVAMRAGHPEDKPYKITMSPIDKATAEKEYKDGDMIKPGSYIMRIVKDAYEPVEIRKHIWPAEQPMVLDHQLIAKQVMLKVNIVYDIEAPATLDPYSVSLIDKLTQISRFVRDGGRVKPGSYFLDIQRPGYTFGPKQEIDIEPSEQPYLINKKLIAKPRKMSFDMVEEGTNRLIPAHQILINGKPVSFNDTFLPGTSIDLVVKFKEFKTVKKITSITPGEGPFVEPVPMKKLEKYEFNVRTNTMKIDGIDYTYELYADAEQIEEHLISIEKGVGRVYYTIRAEKEAKNLRVFCGYLFTQREMENLRLGIAVMNNIDVRRLIGHLGDKSKGERGIREALDIMESMLGKYDQRRMLKQCPPTEIDQLMQYIESFKTADPNDRVRMKTIIDALEKLKS